MNRLNEMEKVEPAMMPSSRDDGRQAFTLPQAWGLFTLVSGAMLGLLAGMPAAVMRQAVFLFCPGLALLLLSAYPLWMRAEMTRSTQAKWRLRAWVAGICLLALALAFHVFHFGLPEGLLLGLLGLAWVRFKSVAGCSACTSGPCRLYGPDQ